MIAAGVGCRSGCSVVDILEAVQRALTQSARALCEVSAPISKAPKPRCLKLPSNLANRC
jgi:hypothetical protein